MVTVIGADEESAKCEFRFRYQFVLGCFIVLHEFWLSCIPKSIAVNSTLAKPVFVLKDPRNTIPPHSIKSLLFDMKDSLVFDLTYPYLSD